MKTVDKNNPQPLYAQVRDLLHERVLSGFFPPHTLIPDERSLAAELGLSRMTVRRAIMDLTREGLFERVRGRGTFVRPPSEFRGKEARAIGTATVAVVAGFDQTEVRNSLFYYRILQGVQQATDQAAISLVFRKVSRPFTEFAGRLKEETLLDGLLVLGIADQELLQTLVKIERPLVLLDSSQPKGGPAFDKVEAAGEQGAFEAVRSLLLLGHREIALMVHAPLTPAGKERREGYERALRAHEAPLRDAWILPTPCESQAAYAVMRRILREARAPTAMFCTSDEMAIGAMAAVKDHGWRIPQEMSVIGFGDIGHFASPPLSTVRMPMEQMGLEAARLLRRRLADPDAPPRRRTLSSEWLPRASCDCPRPAKSSHGPDAGVGQDQQR